ncbi:MAG TPA: hypothetical protein PK765_01430 [bacterium]|nr:hypothetical protein [bacterium]
MSRSPVGIGGGLIFVILLLITRFLSGINAIAMILFSFGSNVKASDSPGIIASTLMLQVGAEFVLLVMAVSVFVLMMRWHRGFSRAFIVLLVVSLLIGVA